MKPPCDGIGINNGLYHLESVSKAQWVKVLTLLYQCLGGVKRLCLIVIYLFIQAKSSSHLTVGNLFLSKPDTKYRRHKKELWKFAVHSSTWCYGLFASEDLKHFDAPSVSSWFSVRSRSAQIVRQVPRTRVLKEGPSHLHFISEKVKYHVSGHMIWCVRSLVSLPLSHLSSLVRS